MDEAELQALARIVEVRDCQDGEEPTPRPSKRSRIAEVLGDVDWPPTSGPAVLSGAAMVRPDILGVCPDAPRLGMLGKA